ncbi:MAG: hypothetical protein J7M19_09675 [Planctomycetes bacterium]|nr:hypothetical protein [Planctomycetota bacterium]
MNRALSTAAVVALLLAVTAVGAVDEPPGDSRHATLVILNFRSDFDSGDVGARVGYSLRAKLRRSERFIMPDELDIEDSDTDASARPAFADVALAREAAHRFAATLVVWGEVAKSGDTYVINAAALDLAGDGAVLSLEKTASSPRRLAATCRELADEVARHFAGEGYIEVYPSKSTEGWRRVGANLVKNGDFEKGRTTPDGWEALDGLCSFWDKDPDAKYGRYVRMDSDVYLAEWRQWRSRFEAGAPASSAPAKTPTSGPKYNTVAGTYGVHLYSDPVKVTPGATYSIELDAKGLQQGWLFFPKVFIKGYGSQGASMELYRCYKAVKCERPTEWQHFSRVFSPTARTPGVKTMKVMILAYWPPGEYAFDNIEIYEVKRENPPIAPPGETP